ncbi:hypothetical protein TNCT_273781 [Trichonephila clavata]|uniref:Uncharacterized protein n=1 Tax=Trichonephila clavata TaxID=2740835 RepID=A0A8X6I2K6_TRICU|nr:hypothetical protein TNCT_273781 [Trichonephila clavata]
MDELVVSSDSMEWMRWLFHPISMGMEEFNDVLSSDSTGMDEFNDVLSSDSTGMDESIDVFFIRFHGNG